MLELPYTDFVICLHTCAIQHQPQNSAPVFTLHSRMRSLTLRYPLQCEATSPSAVCAMKPTQQTTKKKTWNCVVSQRDFNSHVATCAIYILFHTDKWLLHFRPTTPPLCSLQNTGKDIVREALKTSGSRLFLGLSIKFEELH